MESGSTPISISCIFQWLPSVGWQLLPFKWQTSNGNTCKTWDSTGVAGFRRSRGPSSTPTPGHYRTSLSSICLRGQLERHRVEPGASGCQLNELPRLEIWFSAPRRTVTDTIWAALGQWLRFEIQNRNETPRSQRSHSFLKNTLRHIFSRYRLTDSNKSPSLLWRCVIWSCTFTQTAFMFTPLTRPQNRFKRCAVCGCKLSMKSSLYVLRNYD